MGKLPIQWIRQGEGFSSRSPTVARKGNAEHCSVILVEGWSEGLAGGEGDNKMKPCIKADSGKYSLVQSLNA
jgi:hypothetical protein